MNTPETETNAAIRTRDMTDQNGRHVLVKSGYQPHDRSDYHVYDWDHALSHVENHAAGAQEWLDLHTPGSSQINVPGLVFDGDLYFTWETFDTHKFEMNQQKMSSDDKS